MRHTILFILTIALMACGKTEHKLKSDTTGQEYTIPRNVLPEPTSTIECHMIDFNERLLSLGYQARITEICANKVIRNTDGTTTLQEVGLYVERLSGMSFGSPFDDPLQQGKLPLQPNKYHAEIACEAFGFKKTYDFSTHRKYFYIYSIRQLNATTTVTRTKALKSLNEVVCSN